MGRIFRTGSDGISEIDGDWYSRPRPVTPPPVPPPKVPPPPRGTGPNPYPAIALLLLGLASMLGLTAGLAWLLADVGEGRLWSYVAVGVGVFLLLSFLVASRVSDPGGWGFEGWAVVGYLSLLWATWFTVGQVMQWRWVPTIVDNFSPQAVLIELDGAELLKVPSRKSESIRLFRGIHEITVRSLETGRELDRRSIDARPEGGGVYIFNVLGAQIYQKGTVYYGGRGYHLSGPSGGNPDTIQDVWFYTDASYLFEEPPKSISVSRSEDFATRTFLKRLR